MGQHRLLLSLAKAGIISIITISMICSTIRTASALTDETEIESATSEMEDNKQVDHISEDITDSGSVTDSTDVEDSDNENQAAKSESESSVSPDNITDSDNLSDPEDITTSDNLSDSEDITNSDTPFDSEDVTSSDTPSDPGEITDSDTPSDPGEVADSDTPSDPGEVTSSDTVSNPDTVEDSSDSNVSADNNHNSDSHPKSTTEPNLSTQSETSTSSKGTIRDESSDALYIGRGYDPSETFVELNKRITYNAALPLDNIPSFITQEMIIAALKCQDGTGYPASVTIAQIIQESGFGKYGPGGENKQGLSYLAYQYCNLFGIKGAGTAGSVSMQTGEQTSSGKYYTTTASFRVYNTYTECIEDRAKLIKRSYSDLITGVTDANTFAVQIGSRWATSLHYSQYLIQQMERYDLYRLDRMTLMDFSDMIGRFADPCPGSYLTSSFGYRNFDHKFHKGIDLGTSGKILPVYAAEAGTVVRAEYDSLAGNWILIDHGNGLITKYMHFSHTFVKEGQVIIV